MICIEATIYRTRNLDNFYLELFQLVMAKLAIRGHFEESGNHYEKYNLNLSQLVICYSFSNSPRTTENRDLKAIKAQFGEVAKSCKGCHKQFRTK